MAKIDHDVSAKECSAFNTVLWLCSWYPGGMMLDLASPLPLIVHASTAFGVLFPTLHCISCVVKVSLDGMA